MFYFYENCLICVWKRGETLKPVLFILLAFVVAVPLLFMLPLGLSRRGKIAALLVSLLLSLLAVTASAVFPLWQLSLLLLLMALAITYVLDRRFGHVLYAAVEEEDDVFAVEEAMAIEAVEPKQKSARALPLLPDEQVNKPQPIAAELAPFEQLDKAEDSAEVEEWLAEEILDEKTSAPSIIDEKAEMIAWSEEDYLPPLSLEEYETLTEPALADEEESDDTFAWLEESERLDDLLEEELERTADNSIKETVLPLELDNFLGEEFERTADNSLEETSLPLEMEDLLAEEVELQEPKLDALLEEAMLPSEPWGELLEADEPIEQSPVSPSSSPMPNELMQTIIDELRFIRESVSKNEYEQRLLQCMQPSLSDHDYYVFAKMLIEHYLFEKEYDKLSSWLTHLRERFSRYPALLEEIQFLSHIEK